MTRVRIHIDGRAHEAIIETHEGKQRITVDAEPFDITSVTPSETGPRALRVGIGGNKHIIERIDLVHVRVDDAESTFHIEEVERAAGGAAVGASGLTVRPPMPGRIVRLHAAPGDPVHAGDVIAVLEAMKMQNEVTSPGTGVVRRVHVQEGDTVDARSPLLELGPPEEGETPDQTAKEVTV